MENKLEFLESVKEIIKENTDKIEESGEGFNLISILGMESNERYTHSAILAEMFNPKGSHGFKSQFLEAFLKVLKIDFIIENIVVKTEEFVGVVSINDFSSRTFLDIVIKNSCNEVICIENKIWAEDQPYQLERYFNAYINSSKLTLLYLTPSGWEYGNKEMDGKYQKISYEKEILEWLDLCLEISKCKPLVFHSIEIYKNLINKITKQSQYEVMAKELDNMLLASQENYLASIEIAKRVQEINAKFDLFDFIKAKFPLEGKRNFGKNYYKYSIREDSNPNEDPIFITIEFFNDNNEKITNEKIDMLVKKIKEKYHSTRKVDSNDTHQLFACTPTDCFFSNSSFRSNNMDDEIRYKLITNFENFRENQIDIAIQSFEDVLSYLDSQVLLF